MRSRQQNLDHRVVDADRERGDRGVLRDGARVAGGLALEPAHRRDDFARSAGEAQTPARHAVRFGEAVDDDRLALQIGRDRYLAPSYVRCS